MDLARRRKGAGRYITGRDIRLHGIGFARGRQGGGIGHRGLRCEDPDLAMWGWYSPGNSLDGRSYPYAGTTRIRFEGFARLALCKDQRISAPSRGTPWIARLSTECRTPVKRRLGIGRDSLRTGNFPRLNREFGSSPAQRGRGAMRRMVEGASGPMSAASGPLCGPPPPRAGE